MTKLTREKAIELNSLFERTLKGSYFTSAGYIDIFKVANDLDSLKDKERTYILDLLYLARIEQKNIPQLFSGDALLSINNSSVSDFLRNGGFLTVFEVRKKEKEKDDFRFWSIFIITVITLFITLYQVWPSERIPNPKNQVEKPKKTGSQISLPDSSKIDNQKFDSLSKKDSSINLIKPPRKN